MAQTADVVIIGGGVIGLSSAFYIASERYRGAAGGRGGRGGRVVVVEREAVTGAGATGKNAGGIRAQFSTPDNIIFSLRSIEAFERFREETGSELVFNQCGYLFLQTTEEQVMDFTKQAELQRSLGVDVVFMSPEEIHELAPALKVEDVIRGNFFARDGIADPGDVCMGYYNACKRVGVDVRVGHTVTGIHMDGDKITGVQTDHGDITTETIINAAGPYAKEVAAMVGIALDVQPVKRQIVTTGALDYINEQFPMVVDVSTGVYFHRETPGLLMGWADPETPAGYDESVDPDYTDEILMRTLERVPQLESAEVGRAWGGLYEVTPDHKAVIGRAPGVAGMILVNGFSGHGLMHAPAAGMVVSDIFAGVAPRFSIETFSPERFAKGALTYETNVI